MFIKTRTKRASKGGIELAVFEAFWEFLLAVRFFRLWLAVLLVDGFFLGHSVIYGVHKHTIKKRNTYFIVELESQKMKK